MAHLVPSLSFLKTLKRHLQRGRSVNSAISLSIQEENTPFTLLVVRWRALLQASNIKAVQVGETHFQMAFFEILKSGLEGAPIYELLSELEEEMTDEFERQWKVYLERLPLLLSLPLLLFFFRPTLF